MILYRIWKFACGLILLIGVFTLEVELGYVALGMGGGGTLLIIESLFDNLFAKQEVSE